MAPSRHLGLASAVVLAAAWLGCSGSTGVDVPSSDRPATSDAGGAPAKDGAAPPSDAGAATPDGSPATPTKDGGPAPVKDSGAPSTPDAGPPPAPRPGDPFAAARQACLDRINKIRGGAGLRTLARATDQEACVDAQAEKEAKMGPGGTPHGARGMCGEGQATNTYGQSHSDGSGYSPAEYPEFASSAIDRFYGEGPGTYGHYEMLMYPGYTRVACGFYVLKGGSSFGDLLWMNVDYY